ncbi:MAG: hypothetical protein CMJ83_11765 [Planctomycetes bacterium]|nr:hypothetical protein [Planctomycetota bacterium]
MREHPTRSSRVLNSLIIVLWTVLFAGGVSAQVDRLAHLDVQGDPGSSLLLAEGWAPPSFVREPGKQGKITKSPFWCSRCADHGEYAKGARHPAPPEKLLNRPRSDMVATVQGKAKKPPIVLAMPRLILVCDLSPLSARMLKKYEIPWIREHFPKKKTKLDQHAVAHLYAMRCLHLFAQWTDLMCLDPDRKEYRPADHGQTWGNPSMNRGEVWLFPAAEPYHQFCRQFFKGFGKWSSWWYVKPSNQVATLIHAGKLKDDILHARLDHMLAHQHLFEYRGHYYHLPVWIPEGIGHYFERRHEQKFDTFCLLGQPRQKDRSDWEWKARKWKREVRSLVSKNEELPVTKLALSSTSNQDLIPRYHVQAWSMINYMIGMGRGRFRTFIDGLKTKAEDDHVLEAHNNAFRRTFGVSAGQFQARWRGWVLKKQK